MPTSNTRNHSHRGLGSHGLRSPMWIPGTAYYFSAAAACLLVFLSVWGILEEGEEAFAPWLGAFAALVVLVSAVVFREFFLRRARARQMALKRDLDAAVAAAKVHGGAPRPAFKLTQRQNAEIVRRIRKKSEAAKELAGISKAHLEVFELCGEYLVLNKEQIEGANPGSPRLGDLRQGREFVRRLHHFHLLAWAQIESTALTDVARTCDTLSAKFQSAREALKVLEAALQHYPTDPSLKDSETAVRELIASLQISNWFDMAEKQAFDGDPKGAVAWLEKALAFLEAEAAGLSEKDRIKERLESEILRLTLQASTRRDTA